jgi:hypothetical protein
MTTRKQRRRKPLRVSRRRREQTQADDAPANRVWTRREGVASIVSAVVGVLSFTPGYLVKLVLGKSSGADIDAAKSVTAPVAQVVPSPVSSIANNHIRVTKFVAYAVIEDPSWRPPETP